jgi:hypothetical protein
LIGITKISGYGPKPARPPRTRKTDMKPRPTIETAGAVAVEPDDGGHAARIVMVIAGREAGAASMRHLRHTGARPAAQSSPGEWAKLIRKLAGSGSRIKS